MNRVTSSGYPKGIFVPIDLNSLLIDVRVALTAEPWFKELFQSVVDEFGIKREVHQSSLDEEPVL